MRNVTQLRRLLESARRDRAGGRQVYRAPNGERILCESDSEYKWWANFTGALADGAIRPHEFSLRGLFESFVPEGREILDSWNPRHGGGGVTLQESGVTTTTFSSITGQIIYSEVLERFNDPLLIGSQLCPSRSTEFDGEKIPGIGQIGDEAEAIGEAKPYPLAGVTEEYIETPRTTKRGVIVPVTKEAIFFDRTGLVLERAGDVAHSLAINKEKRCLDTALGITTSYRRNGGAAQATYGDTHTEGDFDNLAGSNALADWTDIEIAELLFDAITDPNTGEPIDVMPSQLVVPTALLRTAQRILSATEIRVGDGASASTQTISGNPVAQSRGSGAYTILSNQYVKARTSSATTWFIGQFNRAFRYMENWPITAVQAPPNSEAEFTHDIVQRFKVSERGAPAVIEPRYVVKCTG